MSIKIYAGIGINRSLQIAFSSKVLELFFLKFISKVQNLSLFSKLGLPNKFDRGKVEFELKEERKVILGRNLSRLHFK